MSDELNSIADTQTAWAIDPTHTSVEFAVRNLFLFMVKGSIATREGKIVIDAADSRRSSVTVVLQAASIDSGNQRRDAHLCGADFLDADRYPEIRFHSRQVAPGSDRDTLKIRGLLSIKDQSREVILEVSEIDRSCSPSGEHVAYYSARTELDRHAFGIRHMPGLIGRMLKVTINVQATRRE